MKIVRALEEYEKTDSEIACFLAGGCSSLEWRERFYKRLEKYSLNHLVIYDPYNPNIESIYSQIEWEFKYLNKYIKDKFIFSIYFDKYSNQPVSMYELGRVSVLSQPSYITIDLDENKPGQKHKIFTNYGFPAVITIDEEAPKRQELICQCGLAKLNQHLGTPEDHAEHIAYQYGIIKSQMK